MSHQKQVSKLKEGGGSEYHHRYQRRRRTTHSSSSHGHKSLHESGSQEEFEIIKNSSSRKSKLIIHETHYELEVDVNERGSHSHSHSHDKDKDKDKERKHFSHRHPLDRHKLKEEADIDCEVCELELVGPAYGCAKCEFFMHKTCYKLPREIQHSAHRDHPLTLRSTPAYEKGHNFRCNGCREKGDGFNYHCSTCHYDLHVSCAGMPKVVHPKTLSYSLGLFYRFPKEKESEAVYCFVCDNKISKNGWVYCKKEKNRYCHLDCAFDEEYSGEDDLDDAILAIQDRLKHLQTK